MHFCGDVVLVHDPQPAALLTQRKEAGGHWIWRCHIDVSAPDERVWQLLRPYVEQYDAALLDA